MTCRTVLKSVDNPDNIIVATSLRRSGLLLAITFQCLPKSSSEMSPFVRADFSEECCNFSIPTAVKSSERLRAEPRGLSLHRSFLGTHACRKYAESSSAVERLETFEDTFTV